MGTDLKDAPRRQRGRVKGTDALSRRDGARGAPIGMTREWPVLHQERLRIERGSSVPGAEEKFPSTRTYLQERSLNTDCTRSSRPLMITLVPGCTMRRGQRTPM